MADRSTFRYSGVNDEKAALEAIKSILPPEERDASDALQTEPKPEEKDLYRCKQELDMPSFGAEAESEKKDSYRSENVETSREGRHLKAESSDEQNRSSVDRATTAATSSTTDPSPSPSAGGTLCDVVAAHYNNVPESGLDERSRSRILHLRNFNNWIKSMLIDEYLTKVKETKPRGSSLKVLDMGCGKGGDLFKWRQGKITHLVCADIASTSIEQCKERYEDLARKAARESHFNPIFSAEFIAANCTKERLRERFQDVTLQLDLVSCQFAFHYCFESLPQAECMMRNASECLKPGGYFFGSCPNANAIISRLRKSGGKRFGNDVYSVEFDEPLDDKVPPPIFGAKYNFHMEGVVDCPEFLVHFPTFIRLASRFGLKFVGCEPFQSFFDRMKEKGRGLLGRMSALETYPPFPDQTLMGPLSQYQHAESFIHEQGVQRKIGTLSKSEWEAVTLYLIFVFEKESR